MDRSGIWKNGMAGVLMYLGSELLMEVVLARMLYYVVVILCMYEDWKYEILKNNANGSCRQCNKCRYLERTTASLDIMSHD